MATDNFFNEIAKHWAIVVFFIGMAVTWGVFSQRIATLEAQQSVIELKVQQNDTNLADVKGGLIRIETSLEFIKEKLDN